MRHPVKNKKELTPDVKYNSVKVAKLINYVMEGGKKQIASRIVYDAFDVMKEHKDVKEPLAVFEEALLNVGPSVEVRSRRVGGANYQVPREVPENRRLALALRWMVSIAKARKGKPMHTALAEEIIAASKNEGESFAKKENIRKMAEANRAFAHFGW